MLVSWQAGSSLRTLVGYTITDGQPTEIMRSAYDRYLTADLDGDGQEEVVLAQAEEDSSSTRIEYYDSRDGVLTLHLPPVGWNHRHQQLECRVAGGDRPRPVRHLLFRAGCAAHRRVCVG